MSRSRLATAVRFGVVFVLLLVPRTVFTQQQPMWVPTDLGTLGGPYSSAADINATGQAVGESDTATGFRHAFIWTAAGGMLDLDTLGGPNSGAVAINDAGQVIGQSQTAGIESHAFLWTASGGMTDPGQMAVSDINNIGQIVGTFNDHAFLRMVSGSMIDLGTLGESGSDATAINEAGQVTGLSGCGGYVCAFLWNAADGMFDLGALGLVGEVTDINNAGQIVGDFLKNAQFFHAFIWTAAGGFVDLGTLGGTRSDANGINNEARQYWSVEK